MLIDGIAMVVFDADQTLWDFLGGMRRSLAARLDEIVALEPERAAGLTLGDLVADRAEIGRRHPDIDITDVRRRAFALTLRRLGIDDRPDLVEHLLERFLAERLRPEDVFADVHPCLDRLDDAGVRVAVLTNGNADLAHAHLDHRFELVLRAPDLGVAKPDPAAFRAVERAAGLDPSQLAMVGDDLGPDIAGPIAAGWRAAIWLDRHDVRDTLGHEPTAVVRGLDEVPPLVASTG